jgi:hypothetical protein
LSYLLILLRDFTNFYKATEPMSNFKWSHLDDEDLKDEITLTILIIEDLKQNITARNKIESEKTIDLFLDKLKSLYDEKRKRNNA